MPESGRLPAVRAGGPLLDLGHAWIGSSGAPCVRCGVRDIHDGRATGAVLHMLPVRRPELSASSTAIPSGPDPVSSPADGAVVPPAGAMGAAGGGSGAGAAAALLTVMAMIALQALLPRRLSLELLPWRSALAAQPPTPPG